MEGEQKDLQNTTTEGQTPGVSSPEQQPTPQPEIATPTAKAPAPRHAHTYEDDVSKAMNATDAKVVQEMLTTAREREAVISDNKKALHQRKWYGLFSFIFIILALAGFAYATYHYYRLTVPVKESFSVGVFPSTAPISTAEGDIRTTMASLAALATIERSEPMLVPLVTDNESLVALTKQEFFDYIEAKATEPFIASIDVARLGVMNTGVENTPFLIFSVFDPEIASKEFLIAEPTLLQLYYKALGIDISTHVTEVGKEFVGSHLYNLPVRTLSTAAVGENAPETVLLYGYVTNNIVVLTSKPEVLREVYDTIIRQR